MEQTFEVLARMGLDAGTEFALNADKTQIGINVKRCYDRYTKYRRDHAIQGECLEYRQFTKQLRSSDLFVSYMPFHFDDGSARAFVLDYTAILARCDIESLDGTAIEPL